LNIIHKYRSEYEAELKNMSTTERIKIMEALWNSFLYENAEIESPDWHEKIFEERKRKITNGKAKFISLSELKASHKQ
jgi:hypothetical protein